MSSRTRLLAGAAVAAVATSAYLLSGSSPRNPTDLIKTPGVKNIEKRYSSGGAGADHTPGAASPRGDHTNGNGRNEGSNGWGDEGFRRQQGEMMGG
ncbi:hypothetical protein MMC10_000471 [Thelotrema lepadinum]|nr:hypothetical protein [Thelotrema lepadinum]